MKKTTDYQKEFLEVFKKLSYCRSSWDVWKDFLDMGCISMSNSVPALYREDREKEYLSIIGRYKKEEQELFVVNVGYSKGKTLGQIAVEKPDSLEWYVNQYNGPDNLLRAASKYLIDSALQKAG